MKAAARFFGGGVWVRRASYLLALGLFVAGALRPLVHRTARAIEYLVIFDVSLSMATEDYMERGVPKSRLDVAKAAFREVLPHLPEEARVSVAGFAGRMVQVFLLSWPVRERDAIEAALDVLEWDNVWDVGSRVDLALQDVVRQVRGSGTYLFAGGVPRRAVLPSPLNIVFFTDGGGDEVGDTLSPGTRAWLLQNARVSFVGVGQVWPSPVPEFRRAKVRDCLRSETGECVTSRLHEENLKALAERVAGRYERLGEPARLARLFLDDPLRAEPTPVAMDVGWLFGLGSLAFFLLWVVL